MKCPHCDYDNIPVGDDTCPVCGQALKKPPPGTTVDARLNVDTLAGGEAAAIRAGEVNVQNMTVVLQTTGSSGHEEHIYIPRVTNFEFFGRKGQLQEIDQALTGRARVQLYGLAGIGKTSLAAEAAEKLAEKSVFKDGILWVNEVGNAPLAAVCDAVARHLGDDSIPKLGPRFKPDALRELLARCDELLLVLDHIESPAVVQTFVDVCLPQNVTLLTTNRNKHAASDFDIPVPPLNRNEAIELFKNRAKVQAPDDEISTICDLLGDHSLALVIAAGRVRAESMPLSSLKRRLDDEKTRLKALRIGADDDRSHNVLASLNFSYEILNSEQRELFLRLAACFGDTTGLELFKDVCELPDEWECEDILGQLVARSLVERKDERFGLQKLVRDFGRSMLADKQPVVQKRILEKVTAYLQRYNQNKDEHFDKLEAELSNLLGAMQYAVDIRDYETAVAIASNLGRPVSGVLGVRGYWAELLLVGKSGMQAAQQIRDDKGLARLGHFVAIILHKQGAFEEARRLYLQSMEIYQQQDNQSDLAVITHHLGMLAKSSGDYVEAQRLFEECLASREKIRPTIDEHDPKTLRANELSVSRTLSEMGDIAFMRGEFDRAKDFNSQSMQIKEKLGDKAGVALCLNALGDIQRELGNYPEARQLFQQSGDIYAERGEQYGMAINWQGIGRIDFELGNYSQAKNQFLQCVSIFDKLSSQGNRAMALLDLGRVAREAGDFMEAQRYFRDSQAVFEKLGIKSSIARCLLESGRLALQQKDFPQAKDLIQQSKEIFEQLGEQPGVARSLYELGYLAYQLSEKDQAIQYFQHSLELSDKLGLQPEIARGNFKLGLCFQDQGDSSLAQQRLQSSLKLFTSLGLPDTILVDQALKKL